MDIAIIGAGAAGLAAASVLQRDHKITLYEQSAQIGGLWNADAKYEKTPIYPSLRTNLPMQLMQYPNFDYARLFDPSEPEELYNYPSYTRVLSYLEAFTKEHALSQKIHLNKKISRLAPVEEGWDLHFADGQLGSADAVVVCNGHYSEPNLPVLEGIETFQGRIMHAKDYQKPDDFKGKQVLIWGGNASALDLVREINTTASRIFWCGHATSMSEIAAELPQVRIKSDPIGFEGATVVLKSGEHLNDIDTVLFCTGYRYSFPFLDPDLVEVDDNLVAPLYRQILSVKHPTLAFIGLPFLVIPFPMFLIQSQWLRAILNAPGRLPAPSTMHLESQREIKAHLRLGKLKRHFHRLGPGQVQYLKQLIDDAELDPMPDDFFTLLQRIQQLRQDYPSDYRRMAIYPPYPSHQPPA
ncbi:MAG: NAD(P)-binding domain-containing protein [Pseudomonadales bacterium]